jgi:hypothetical protein
MIDQDALRCWAPICDRKTRTCTDVSYGCQAQMRRGRTDERDGSFACARKLAREESDSLAYDDSLVRGNRLLLES